MLYVLRHGRTDWNEQLKLQGRTDIPLNEEGIRQAEEAGEKYKDLNFDICFCSPLIRAKQTAEIVLKNREISINYDNRLIEMSFGIYEGLAKVIENDIEPVCTLFKNPAEYKGCEGGESIDDVMKRADSFYREKIVPELEKNKSVLVVAHGAFNSAFITNYYKKDKADFWSVPIGNCQLHELGEVDNYVGNRSFRTE